MRFTLSWLMRYLDTDASLELIIEKLSYIGLEVDSVDYCDNLKSFVVVQVLEVVRHHAADKLKICKVYDGKQVYQVVCGASNVEVGMRSVLAHVGSVMPKNQATIKVVKLRGVDSQGMLCSRDELGIIGDNVFDDGIIDLPADYNVGDPFFPSDPIIEVNVTPNRGDCLGVYGIARDLAAAGIGKLKLVNYGNISSECSNTFPFEVCLQTKGIVKGRYIKGVKNRESPKWLKDYLFACGIKSISYIVDVTNYIMLSFNRPLHVYDAKKIKGNRLIFKKADSQIEFSALNNKTYLLGTENIVSVDSSDTIHSVAAVIGSELSKCLLDTEDIFLESAWFDPVDVALSSRRIKLSTDSSCRFERFLDPDFMENGLNLATEMILEYCGGVSYSIISAENYVFSDIKLDFSPESVKKTGNVCISKRQIFNFLSALGFIVDTNDNRVWKVIPPPWRSGMSHSSDLVGEILRLYGYDKISEEPIQNVFSHVDVGDNLHNRLRLVLLSEGLTEVLTWSFTSMAIAKKLGYEEELMLIDNPVNNNLNLMRPSILLNLLQVVSENQAYGNSEIAIFEIGQVYNVNNICGDSSYVVSGVRYGNNLPRNLYKIDRSVDVFDVKSDVISILQELNIEYDSVDLRKSDRSFLHPVRSADVYFNDILIGYFGELHPDVTYSYEINRPMVCFEVFLYKVPKIGVVRKKFKDSRYQLVKRDFAFLIDKDVSVQRLVDVVKNSNSQLIDNVLVFDLYEGDNIADNVLSVALSVTFKPIDHTLNDQEIKDASDMIINSVAQVLGGVLRSF